MQSFLEKTVIHLYDKYGDDISELCIVVPNRRAGLFFKNHLASVLKKTSWAPEIVATEDFIALLAELEIVDSTTLLFELYETVKLIGEKEDETFDEFSKWGQILLNDFNEIDRYLVDASQLFGNLKDIKELEAWSLNSEEKLTDFQKQYLTFWKLLGTYYTEFKNRLLQKNQAYQGLAYRIVANEIEERINKHSWKKIIFCGFNALNKAEENIIKTLLNTNKAEIIWDADSYYLDNKNQEAGRFIRKYNEQTVFKNTAERNTIFLEDLLSKKKKSITIIGIAKNVAQAKVAGNIVADLQQENNNLQNTALVLADENLLFPVLHSLPSNLADINVTMGYPLKNTPVAGYFDLILSMHENALKLSKGKTPYSYYYTDVIKLLSHPYTAVLLANSKALKSVIQIIQKRNIVFASVTTIASIFTEKFADSDFEKLQPIFKYWQNPNEGLTCIYYLINGLKTEIINNLESGDNKTNLELEYLFAFTKIIKRLDVLMQNYHTSITDLKTLKGIFNQIVRTTTLPFYGEPLMGLQVMGMLETRTLDFKNIILLSCNEDILPSAKTSNSFIPFELKRYFGLSTHSDKDAIFAYHFYRLLQRATNIYLLYNTELDALGSGEKSRFLTQLIYELPKVNPHITITEKLLNIPITKNSNEPINIIKTPEIIELLKQKAVYGFSPSLLNKYRNCSLQFYFHAIAGLKEEEEVEETIGADMLGNMVHQVLEQLYQPFIDKKITTTHIQELKKNAETAVNEAFEKEYSKSEISYGKNLLTLKVALKFIVNFLSAEIKLIADADKKSQPLIIKALEQELQTSLMINNIPVNIKGKVDRIDSLGKIIRIIDYKTGKAEEKELKIEDWDNIRTESVLAKSFQLLTYAFLYQKNNPTITDNIISGIITFRALSAGLKTVKINNNEILNTDVLKDFEHQLHQLIEDIFNPLLPFAKTSLLENCEFCAFKGICNR